MLPVFACAINDPVLGDAFGATIGLASGGTGYSSAVVKVVILDTQGNALQTQTVTASTADDNYSWQLVIDPDGDGPNGVPLSGLYAQDEASCTATVQSAS